MTGLESRFCKCIVPISRDFFIVPILFRLNSSVVESIGSMPDHCFIGSCSSSGNIPGVHYFSFGSKKKEWLEILGISGVENMSPRNKLCSRHFDCCDINFPATPSGRATLKKNAVPKYFLRNKRAPEDLPPGNEIKGNLIRKKLSKLILFNHQ
ncbi:uncharacterized protein [Leptinotarsa decemlineata]|uniref:uncharacterized protein n=1 Tax=Leptinotarsa decemlineata TaxID=7539 RepID=UPI003D304765